METFTTAPGSTPILDKDDYYKDVEFCTFSFLKVFSRCETLFEDLYITKTYEEGEQDYFTYGKLVDALLTEPASYIDEHFIRVERKIKIEDALKIENEIQELKNYITNPEFIAKLDKGNLTAQKGFDKRTKEIAALEAQLDVISSLSDKVQVTPSIWREADETALAIKTHPSFVNMVFNELTSQQVFKATINGVKRKGRLDHLKLSPAVEKIYAIYKAGKFTAEEVKQKVAELNENDKWAIITDIKTCYAVSKLEPYNTHYRGQLGYYQDLVRNFFGFSDTRVACRILVGDKQSNEFKVSELFQYTQRALDELKPDVEAWVQKWQQAITHNTYISDKQKNGMKQNCFKCSKCRICPFSIKHGEPVLIDAPRFEKNAYLQTNVDSGDSPELKEY